MTEKHDFTKRNMEDRAMGKATKRARNTRNTRKRPVKGRSHNNLARRRFLFGSMGMIVAGMAAGFGLYRFTRSSSPPVQAKPFPPEDLAKLPRHETRPTLPPTLFAGSVAAAYAVAKKVPALLDQLYCYCRCKENFGHRSLLSCYVGRHAST